MTSPKKVQTLNVLTAALGGEGGGVFTEWISEAALLNGWMSQSTYLAGVAQRTGATIYYTELLPRSEAAEARPVMSLFPHQGDIDVAITSEIAEAGRMLQRGFITPGRTTLISSTHRVYSITEKINLLDGTIDADKLLQLGQQYARAFVRFDMQSVAERHGAVISAALLGALAGAKVLPFSKDCFEDVIRASGRSVRQNIGAFNDSFVLARGGKLELDATSTGDVQTFIPQVWKKEQRKEDQADFELPAPKTTKGRVLLERIRHSLPQNTHYIIYQGITKTTEYQDFQYASQYLDEIINIAHADQEGGGYKLTNEVARYLALWMCYEDIPRVAQLKIRPKRAAEMAAEVRLKDEQLMRPIEYFHPRVEEICAMLPHWLGRRMMQSKRWNKFLNSMFAGDSKLRTDRIGTHFMLRILASWRRWRRSSLGFAHEHKMIQAWLEAVKEAAQTSNELALAVTECARLVKGYSYTRERTTAQLTTIIELVMAGEVDDPAAITALLEAATAGDDNKAFAAQLKL